MGEDEPFDSLGGDPSPRKSSPPNAPPAFAFGHHGSMTTPTSVPPPNAFATTASAVQDEEDGLGAIPSRSAGREHSIMSTDLNDRWKEQEALSHNDSTPEKSRTSPQPADAMRQEQPYKLSTAARTELAPRQPYSMRKTQSYDTEELIRKYGGISGVAPIMNTTRLSTSSASSMRPSDVRDQAHKMLELVDDHLKTPFEVRRTESGGFRAAPSNIPTEEGSPYSFRRSVSAGKRVPAALSGLNLSAKTSESWRDPGRYSFKDSSFRNDDHFSDEEDHIVQPEVPFEDEPVVDVVAMEGRAAVSRPYSDDKKFEGDFEGGSKTWSSRYSDTATYATQKHILDQWDREFEQEQGRKSARNMFMSTASDIRDTASNAWSSVGSRNPQVFGSGGFSFRANHVFGNHRSAAERDEVNLRAAWKEIDEAPTYGPPPVHKTWQEVMLNKRKRRRILAIFAIIIVAVIVVSTTLSAAKNQKSEPAAFAGYDAGESITFYVTSDTPADAASEERLVKDLINIPIDSEFVIHLGNIQDSDISLCPKTRYSDVASILTKSPVPLFIVPGADDWTKCPNPVASLTYWMNSFKDFDLKFKHGLPVKRDSQNPEAFAFLHKGVLFMGLHIVSGPVVEDAEDWVGRQKAMLKFYYGIANMNKGEFRSVVLLGNARPSAQQALFFETLLSNLKEHHAPIVYIHANQKGDDILQHYPFESRKDILAVGIQNGSLFAPLKITVGFGEKIFTVG